MKFLTVFGALPEIIQLIARLFLIWITLGWKVRKARKAFEKELVLQGISREDARRLSKQIKILKDSLTSSIWQFAFNSQVFVKA